MKKRKKSAARSAPRSHKSNLHNHVPMITVIATVVLVVLGLGVWLKAALLNVVAR